MEGILITLNAVFTHLYFPPCVLWIVLLSWGTAVLFLLIFKYTSRQDKIRFHKRKVAGHIMEIRVYGDAFRTVASSLVSVIKHNVIYLCYVVPPLLVLVIPAAVISIQINNRCGYRALKPGEPFIISAELDEKTAGEFPYHVLEKVECETSPGIVLETLPLRIPTERSVLWRARVASHRGPGREWVRFSISDLGRMVEKRIVVHPPSGMWSPEKIKWSLSRGLIFNAEGFMPEDSFLDSIAVQYERAGYRLLWWKVDPLVIYFALTMLFALAMRSLIRVQI